MTAEKKLSQQRLSLLELAGALSQCVGGVPRERGELDEVLRVQAALLRRMESRG